MHSGDRLPWHEDGETLVVETPEQIRLEFRIAPFGSRMLAALLDRAMVGSVLLALVIIAAFCLDPSEFGGGVIWAGVIVAYFLVSLFYFVIAEVRGEGTTPGKRRIGLRTIHETGRGITFGASLIRNLARVVDEIPIAWLVPALTKGRRRIGDLLGGTFVVEAERKTLPTYDWIGRLAPSYAALPEKQFPLPPSALAQLDPEDLNLIEYLGTRLVDTPSSAREKMLLEIAQRYVTRLGIADRGIDVELAPGRFLQELGLLLRAKYDHH